MTNKAISIVVILAALVVVGFVLLNSNQAPSPAGTDGTPGTETERPITEAEKLAIFNPPGDGSTERERDDYSALLNRAAVETDTITIGSGCSAEPFLALVRVGSTVTIENNDTLPHEILFGGTRVFVEDKGDTGPGTAQLEINFPDTVLLGYSCLDVDLGGRAAAGGLYILPPPQEGPPPS